MGKKRGMSSQQARNVRNKGHEDARLFAKVLGIAKEYRSDLRAKKDIIDTEGNSYSVKSGQKKWQIFLYSKKRFQEDVIFQGIDDLGHLFIECIDSFPESWEEYERNKVKYKKKLQRPMRELAKKLSDKKILRAFLDKSLFNGGEVDFFVVKDGKYFHVFYNKDVVDKLSQEIIVQNSKARHTGQMDDQKVVFKASPKEGERPKTIGEIEMRTDSSVHYREVKFWLGKKETLALLQEISPKEEIKRAEYVIVVYNGAIKKLKRVLNPSKDSGPFARVTQFIRKLIRTLLQLLRVAFPGSPN